jgi:hypothetical protein
MRLALSGPITVLCLLCINCNVSPDVPAADPAALSSSLSAVTGADKTELTAQVVAQVPLAGSAIAQFVDPLPLLDLTASGTIGIDTLVAGPDEIELHMREFRANVMPTGFVPANGQPYAGTAVFGYINGPDVPATWGR